MSLFRLSCIVCLLVACAREPVPAPPAPRVVSPPAAPSGAATVPTTRRPERIAADRLMAELSSAEPPIVVDVRSASEHRRRRIPGSIQLDLVQLSASPLLATPGLVVVDDGSGARRLDEQVRRWRRQRRHVRMLDGGMQAWCRAGGPTNRPCDGRDRLSAGDASRALSRDDTALLVPAPGGDVGSAARALVSPGIRRLVVATRDAAPGLRDALHRAVDAHLFFTDAAPERLQLQPARPSAPSPRASECR